MAVLDIVPAREAEIGGRMLGAQVLRVTPVRGGRNSRVHRVDTRVGTFALKQYPRPELDGRDRLDVEVGALQWMASHGLDMVPRVLAVDAAENCAILSWVEGVPVGEVIAADIDQAIDFLALMEKLRRTAPLPDARAASEACLSGREIERQIRTRRADLSLLKNEPELQSFLREEFANTFETSVSAAQRHLASAGISFEAELAKDKRSLVPSDFGFHNVLRNSSGRLVFLDFEYFGWDDPVKLVCDTLLHPGTPVASPLRRRFRTAAQQLYATDADFSTRLNALYPLFVLRWVLILLNEFFPERWRRRVVAGAGGDWTEAKARQLQAARAMLMNGGL